MKKISFIETVIFNKKVKILSKKYKSLPNDIETLKEDLQQNPLKGVSLGNNIYKVRLPILSKGRGKSAGGRVIHLNCIADLNNPEIILLYLFDKNEFPNISKEFISRLVKEHYKK